MGLLSSSVDAIETKTRNSVTRVLIDCSQIRFDGQRTGIPRVVANYVRYGHAFAQQNGISVISVGLTRDKRLRARNAAAGMGVKVNSTSRSATVLALKILLELLRYFVRLLIAVVAVIRAALPIRALVRWTRELSLWLRRIRWRVRSRLELAKGGAGYIEPGPGDVLFCPGYWHDYDAAIYETFHAQGAEIVLLIHDLAPVTSPAHYEYPWRWRFEQRLARSLDYVAHYYCVSRKTMTDLSEFAVQRRRTVHASVAYNGFEPLSPRVRADIAAAHSPLLSRGPWLMVGSLEPKKGHREALAAFDSLWSTGYCRPLVVIGRRGWMCEDIVETIQSSCWLGTHLFWFDTIGDEELPTFYECAHALLFSSYIEGFGLPLLEAASYGLPILASDIPTSREILGFSCSFFATSNELINGIKSLEEAANLRAAQECAKMLTWFDWRSVVESVMVDILRPTEERRLGTKLLEDCALQRMFGALPDSAP